MKSVHLNYDGGSGGFFALWIILLATEYRCEFDLTEQTTTEHVFNSHWNIGELWKDSEIWPDNQKTKESKIAQKIYFTCLVGVKSAEILQKHNGIKIGIYTDIKTQDALCKFKNANHFYKNNKLKGYLKDMYQNIKDNTWPEKLLINNFTNLDARIQEELNTVVDESFGEFNTVADMINTMDNYNPKLAVSNYNNMQISSRAFEIINNSDIAVSWQDLIRSKGQCLLSPLGYKPNKRCDDFVDYYVKLHPTNIIKEHVYG